MLDHAVDASIAATRLRTLLLLNRAGDALQIALGVERLIEAVVRQLQRRATESASLAHRAPRLTSWRLACLDALIEAHLSSQLAVADLAAAVQLSEGYLTRTFRAATGLTPHAYVGNRRVARSRYLLVHSRVSLRVIAEHRGFADHAHFSHAFRHRIGMHAIRLSSPLRHVARRAPPHGARRCRSCALLPRCARCHRRR